MIRRFCTLLKNIVQNTLQKMYDLRIDIANYKEIYYDIGSPPGSTLSARRGGRNFYDFSDYN
jgi:hypothetical protein